MKHPIQITNPARSLNDRNNKVTIERLEKKGVDVAIYKTNKGYVVCREYLEEDELKLKKRSSSGTFVAVTREDISNGYMRDKFEYMKEI